MKIDDFLEFNKYDLEDCIANNPTTFTVESLIPALKDIIIILEELRTSKGRTENAIRDILKRHKRKKTIGGYYDESGNKVPDTFIYERTVESDIFQMWLVRFIDLNESYYYAYNAIVPYCNEESGFPINLKDVTQKELMEAIRLDDSPGVVDDGNEHDKSSTSKDLGKLNFEESTLTILHGLFNEDGKLWEKISITGYYDNFKEIPALTLKIKNKIAFSYLIRKYDEKQVGILHMQDWFRNHFGIDNTSNSKNRMNHSERVIRKNDTGTKYIRRTKEDILIEYIDNKLKPI